MNNLPIIDGVKCYPVGSWENNQHKIYNAHDKAMNALYDYFEGDAMDEDYDGYEKASQWVRKVEEVLYMFDNHIYRGVVYLPYPQYKIAKEIIASY